MQRTTLRTMLTVAIGVLGALALVAAVALVALTGLLERSAGEMAVSGRSVQRVEELEIALLGLDRAAPAERQRHVADLSRRLADLPVHLADDGEAALYARVRRAVAAYLGGGPTVESAGVFATLHQLADLNARQAAEAAARAESLHRIAVWLGATIAGLLLAGGAALIVWLRRRALAPLLHIREAIARYGRGDRAARAPEHGPAELADMARRFNQLAANLERQQVAQLTFLAGVAHDLRNPLAALRSSADLLSIGPPDPTRQRVAAVLGRQVDRIDRMLGDLLDGVRIEAGELELRPERCSVPTLAEEVVELYRSTTPSHEIDLVVDAEDAVVTADPTRLGQVLTNLISNGIKYSPDGGRIEVAIGVEGQKVAISVADRGIGIEPGDLQRIFEPFQRVGHARDQIPGTGLGLSVVRRIVQAHGGEIRVMSEPGLGSTFEIRLDRLADGTSAASPPT